MTGLLLVMLLARDPMPPKDRIAELKTLGRSKDVIGAVDKLAASLDSLDDAVREATLQALRELLASRDFPKLFDDKKTPIKTRKNVLKTLRYLKEPRFTPLAIKGLGDGEPSIRSEAALVLSVYGAADAEPQLIAALADAEKDVRYYAADALGGLKSDAAKQAVENRLKVETDKTVIFSLQQAGKKQSR